LSALKGLVDPPGLILDDATRAGVDGSAYLEMQSTGEPFEMEGIRDCTDATDAATKYAALKAMQGTKVSVIDDYGKTWLDVVILRVRRSFQHKLINAAGGVLSGTGRAVLGVRFLMQVSKEQA
jgi:hypothetical protein